METLFTILVYLLLGIALFDLVVGVSNDAVNFLTSALGSRAATFRTIMIVASIGVFVGAASSGGMMEVAKRGVFNPALFTFQDVMFIYVVVMLTDIFLLDFFNSMKLPTSTTISIVFELLGASLAVSFLHVMTAEQSISDWMTYINTAKALQMIVAIFISVGIAFAAGWLLQYLIRALLTFDYERYMRIGGAVFGGIATVVVVNFIVFVGLKNSPLREIGIVEFISVNTIVVYLAVFAAAFVLFAVLARRGSNPFKIITLLGTFALAMAFASNDLVNFIGVPVAGFEAFEFWQSSGLGADEYMMDVFAGDAGASTANPIFLYLAGAVMVLTLWRSKKARNVIQTSVNLSRQNEGSEQFQGNDIVRNVVRFVGFVANGVASLFPRVFREAVTRRYSRLPDLHITRVDDPPAFDLVRASTNLIIAAALISMGTLLKLPLSTTYVSFMVLMGTSLADRAWNRDSAVYRVSGVFAVVGGWFMTAIVALALSIGFAVLAVQFGFLGLLMVIVLVALGIYVVNRYTDNKVKVHVIPDLPERWFSETTETLRPYLVSKVQEIAGTYGSFVDEITEAIIHEDRHRIRDMKARLKEQERLNFEYRGALTHNLSLVKVDHMDVGRTLVGFYALEFDLLHHGKMTLTNAWLHVLNMHRPLEPDQREMLKELGTLINEYVQEIVGLEGSEKTILDDRLRRIRERIDQAVRDQIQGNIDGRFSHKNNELLLSILFRNLNASDVLRQMILLARGDSAMQPAST